MKNEEQVELTDNHKEQKMKILKAFVHTRNTLTDLLKKQFGKTMKYNELKDIIDEIEDMEIEEREVVKYINLEEPTAYRTIMDSFEGYFYYVLEFLESKFGEKELFETLDSLLCEWYVIRDEFEKTVDIAFDETLIS